MACCPAGQWRRLQGCTYSEMCAECGQSDDSMEAALLRQFEAAGRSSSVAPRRVVCTFVSDMKGLMQICGHAGPSATWNCLLCMARLHQTSKAGVPHLPELPEPWRSQDARDADIICPPARKGTDEMARYATAYAEASAAQNAPQQLSSEAYASCTNMPMIATVFPDVPPTPKMHVLCFHMEELARRHGSIGIDTEQGIESFHPEFNYVMNMFRSMDRQPERQLAAVVGRLCARGGGKRERGSEGVKEEKQRRTEKAREKSKKK